MLKKQIIITIFTVGVCLFYYTIMLNGDIGNSYVRVRAGYGSDDPFLYKNFMLKYMVLYQPNDMVRFSAKLSKLAGETGYYPLGYFSNSGEGFYERGSYFLEFRDFFGFNRLVIGNYLPRFGQGLLFGSPYSLFFDDPYYGLARYRDDIFPYVSYSKSLMLEGVAAEIESVLGTLRPFISWNYYDCSAGESDYYAYNDNDGDGIPNDTDPDDFTNRAKGFPNTYSCKTALQNVVSNETLYDSDEQEARRNKLGEYVIGCNISKSWARFRGGLTGTYTRFSRLIDPYYNFTPDEGDKNGNYFRGLGYMASNVYFKITEPVEIFTEVVGTAYNRKSYYPEFNGKYVVALGISSSMKFNAGNTGYLVWGSYLSPQLVNPHGVEFPDGRNNMVAAVFDVHSKTRWGRVNQWVYLFHELYNSDDPGFEESKLSYNYRIDAPIFRNASLSMTQHLIVYDNYYYAPETRSYKLISKLRYIYRCAENQELSSTLETRIGGEARGKVQGGIGLGPTFNIKARSIKSVASLFFYMTKESPFAWLYPYDPSLYVWSFFPRAVYGKGIEGSFSVTNRTRGGILYGVKLRYDFDFFNMEKRIMQFYVISEIPL